MGRLESAFVREELARTVFRELKVVVWKVGCAFCPPVMAAKLKP